MRWNPMQSDTQPNWGFGLRSEPLDWARITRGNISKPAVRSEEQTTAVGTHLENVMWKKLLVLWFHLTSVSIDDFRRLLTVNHLALHEEEQSKQDTCPFSAWLLLGSTSWPFCNDVMQVLFFLFFFRAALSECARGHTILLTAVEFLEWAICWNLSASSQ